MLGRAGGGAAHHPTCGRRRAQRAQAPALAAARHPLRALASVRERERQLRSRVVSVQRHRAAFRCGRARACEQRRYFRLYRVGRVWRRRRLILRGPQRHREHLARRACFLRVHALPRTGPGRASRALRRCRQVVHAAERESDLPEHLGVVRLLIAVSAYRYPRESGERDISSVRN